MHYYELMTISTRNKFFAAGIVFSVLTLALISLGGYYAFPAFNQAVQNASFRAAALINSLVSGFFGVSPIVPFISIVSSAAYSLLGIILIFYYFEKTQSNEIIFFAFFVISHSFEFTRVLVPLREIHYLPSIYMIYSARLLLFGRFIGLFSLFASAIYAAGLDIQKQRTSFFMIIMSSLIISMNIPINSLIWDTTFKLMYAYTEMLGIAEIGIIIITVITFFVSAYKRGSKTYNYIAIGALLVFFGRNTLFASDNWFTLVPGFISLAAGTWIICIRLHREYLWL